MSQLLRNEENQDWVVETTELYLSGEPMILADPWYDEGIADLLQRGHQDPLITSRLGTCFNRVKSGNYAFRLKREDGASQGPIAGWILNHQNVSTYAQKIELDILVDSEKVGFFKAADAYQLTEADFINQPFYHCFKAMKTRWSNKHPDYAGQLDWYMYMCATTLIDNAEFDFNASGICTSSGEGNGCYEAFAYLNEADELVALQIEFIKNVEPWCDNCGTLEDSCTCSDDEDDATDHY